MPEIQTHAVADITGVADWVATHTSAEDTLKVNAIIERYGKIKQQQFAELPTQWEIDWFYQGLVKVFYRIALVDTQSQRELWAFS